MTLCSYCCKGDAGECPVYPLETTGCVEFVAHQETAHDAALIIAGGLRSASDAADSQRRFGLLCRVIGGES